MMIFDSMISILLSVFIVFKAIHQIFLLRDTTNLKNKEDILLYLKTLIKDPYVFLLVLVVIPLYCYDMYILATMVDLQNPTVNYILQLIGGFYLTKFILSLVLKRI